jgi:endothelin-converting enzyme/putative endopeptidase
MMIVALNAGGLGLPDRDYYTKSDAKSEDIRKRYVAYLAGLLALSGVPQASADQQAAATMKIETALAKASLTRVERRDPYNIYHPMKLEEVEAIAPALELGDFFRGENLPATSLEKINVSQPKFYQALQAELAGEPLDDLKAYLRTHALNTACRASLRMRSSISTASFCVAFRRCSRDGSAAFARSTAILGRRLGRSSLRALFRRTPRRRWSR